MDKAKGSGRRGERRGGAQGRGLPGRESGRSGMTDLFERVAGVVAEVLAADAAGISRGTRIGEDLGADSLDQVELVIALEEAFDVEIDDDEPAARSLATVGELADYVAGLLAAKTAADAAEGAA